MGESYIGYAQKISQMAALLKEGQMDFSQIPFQEIIASIQRVYGERIQKGEEFSLLYGGLITKGLGHRDYEEVADVLRMLAHHLVIFTNDNARYSRLQVDRKRIQEDCFRLQSEVGYLKNNVKIMDWNKRYGESTRVSFQGKGVVYSVITGAYDDVKEPQNVNPEFDYILFTDNPDIKSDVWEIRLVENEDGLDNVRFSRKMKILAHEYLAEYDYSIYVDGKIQIIGDVKEYIESYRGNQPMLSFNHYVNDCIYQEMEACKVLKKDEPDIMEKQIAKYRAKGYPEHNGLTENAVIVREHNDERVKQVMETWWNEVVTESRRDQLSFCYSCWKHDFVYDTSPLYIYVNKYFRLCAHN